MMPKMNGAAMPPTTRRIAAQPPQPQTTNFEAHAALNRLEAAYKAYQEGEAQQCIRCCDWVLQRHPDNKDALRLKSLAHMSELQYVKAYNTLVRAVKLYPDDYILLTNMAALCYQTGRDEESAHFIQRAVAAQQEREEGVAPATRWTQGLIRLKAGDYSPGAWLDYEHRFLVGESKILAPPKMMWDGSYLGPDETLVIAGEQGAGDYVQMARFFQLAKERSGAKVILACPKNLETLLGGFVDGTTQTVKHTDRHIPIFSLPRVLDIGMEQISGKPYLAFERRPPRTKPTVGFCWAGNQDVPELRDRSCPANLFGVLQWTERGEPDYAIKILQYGDASFTPTDFCETARHVAACDAVVTIDTSIAHIAGAAGVPTFLLLRYQGDFRWMRKRLDTPWYDSVRLYRQPAIGDWESVIAEARKDLIKFVGAHVALHKQEFSLKPTS